ncbi:MAG: hypothetical protein OEY28_06240 [Nitrospira sp.]|nr:hypothetical protein [Nitrospira sp.]
MNHDIKELLTLAAKACGYTLVWGEAYRVGDDIVDCTDMPYIKSDSPDEFDAYWTPHLDDGDCFRMETDMVVSVIWKKHHVSGFCRPDLGATEIEIFCHEKYKDHNGDKNAARKLASLRAVAELGRRM